METIIFQNKPKMENQSMECIKISDFAKNRENPFLQQALEEINRNIVKKYKTSTGADQKATLIAIDPNTAEVLGHTRFIRQIEVDEERFAKLYLSNFASFFDLSQAAIRVFGYILSCLKQSTDYVIFDREKCKEFTHYKTDKAIYKGLAELMRAEIIARGPADNLLFINPLVVFNGDRVSFAQTFVMRKESERIQPELPFEKADALARQGWED